MQPVERGQGLLEVIADLLNRVTVGGIGGRAHGQLLVEPGTCLGHQRKPGPQGRSPSRRNLDPAPAHRRPVVVPSGVSQLSLTTRSRVARARWTLARMDSAVAVHTYGLGFSLWTVR